MAKEGKRIPLGTALCVVALAVYLLALLVVPAYWAFEKRMARCDTAPAGVLPRYHGHF